MVEDTDTLRREVADARTQLGETVEALAHKAAAPRRAGRAAALRARSVGPPLLGLALLGLAIGVGLALRARR